MKKILAALVCLLMLLSAVACSGTETADATPAKRAQTWMEHQIQHNTLFSFDYDGVVYADHIKAWEKKVDTVDGGWNLTYTSKDGVVFTVTATYDADHAALDWVGSFTYTGSGRSPVISNVMILDSVFDIENAIMTTANQGGTVNIDDYQAYETDLVKKGSIQLKNYGGRSSQGAWPWFDITSGDDTYGIMGAIGWSGNWQVSHAYENGKVYTKAGMQTTNYYMESGETFRTPSMVIQFFDGTQDDGHNDWRQLILANYNPTTANGDPVTFIPLTVSCWGGKGSEELINIVKQLDDAGQYYEYQWIDAGWYGDYLTIEPYDDTWCRELGNWYYNPGFDGVGFTEIAAYHEQNGTDFLVWFEPGRAYGGTQLVAEHPELFLPTNPADTGDNVIYHTDYGKPEAVEYMTDMIIGFLEDMDTKFYRQDYNFDPAEGWNRKDRLMDENGNRVGVAEIQYVTGHYQFLDNIAAAGYQIDNCASGGRLIDIEMTKRAVPLWRSDYTCADASAYTYNSGVYSQGAGLSWWVVHSGQAAGSEGYHTHYGFRSLLTSGGNIGLFPDTALANKLTDELLHNREYMLHDFYILTQGYGRETNTKNAGYEFHIPEQGRGYLVCFRPSESDTEATSFRLKGLEAEATYVVRNADNGETIEFTGEQLMTTGLKVQFPRVMVSHMIYFDKK